MQFGLKVTGKVDLATVIGYLAIGSRSKQMDTNDLWMTQVNLLSKQTANLLERVDQLETRIEYYENVLVTLIVALKKGGIIIEDSEGENEMP